MIENINLDGANVSAELHAVMYDYVYGYNGVFNYGQKLVHEIVSNNEIRIKDGLLINQGRFMRIVTGSYESLSILNGTTGVNRIDLIVAHFETDGVNEIHDIRVIKGTGATEPTPVTGNTFTGARINQMPLYSVAITGLAITSVTPKFTLIKSVKDHTHTKSQVTDFPTSLKSPTSMKVQLNGGTTEGTNQFTYDGSVAKALNITSTLIGLGNVPNVATNNQTPTYTDISTLATLVSGETMSTALPKIKLAITNLINHIANVSNPHSTTKTHVGLGSVPNVATNDQTPTYTDITTLTTLATGEKLSVAFPKIKLAITNLISHLANVSNPHTTTKAQVGLGNVENKTGATIRSEMTLAEVVKALTYTPIKQLATSNINVNTLVENGIYTVVGTTQTNTPYVASWTMRVEVTNTTYITQWITKSDGTATYKRTCVNSVWGSWVLVEGEEVIYTGSIENQKTVDLGFDVKARFKKLFIFVAEVGYIEVTQRDVNVWSGTTVIFNTGYATGYIGICSVYIDGSNISNKVCGHRQFADLGNLINVTANITKIIGRP